MSPHKLLRDGSFGNLTELVEERSLLEINVHAVSKAMVCLADELILVNDEWVAHFASALLKARNRSLSNLLREAS